MSVEVYRWECWRCRQHGRWLRDPGSAKHYGVMHDERRHARTEHASHLVQRRPDGSTMTVRKVW